MLSDEIFLIKYSYSYLSLDFGDYTTAIVFVKKKKKVIKIAHRFITIYVSFFVLLDLTYLLDSSIYLPHLALL